MANTNLTGTTIATTYKKLLIAADEDSVVGQTSSATQIICGTGTAGTGNTLTTPLYLSRDRVGIGTATPVNAKVQIEHIAGDTVRGLTLTDESGAQASIAPTGAGEDTGSGDKFAHFGYNFYADADDNLDHRGGTNYASGISFGGTIDLWTSPSTAYNNPVTYNTAISILQNGNVGVNVNTPEKKLHIVHDSSTTEYPLMVENPNASAGARTGILFEVYDQEASIEVERDGANAGVDMRFYVAQGHTDTSPGTKTERLTILESGNVGIGTASPNVLLHVEADNAEAQVYITRGYETASGTIGDDAILGSIWFGGQDADSGADPDGCIIKAVTNGVWSGSDRSAELQFWTQSGTSPGQEMTITSTGNVGIGTDAPSYPLVVKVDDGTDNHFIAQLINADADNPEGLIIQFTGADFTSASITDDRAIMYEDSNSTNFAVYSDGGVLADESDHVSDIRLKENIVDVSAKLDDLNKLKVRNFNYKGKDATEAKRIGFIADELETVFPKIIKKRALKKNGVDYTDLKMIRYEPIVAILVKAVQELSAKVTTLESA